MEPMTLSNLLTHPGLSGWKARTAKVETGGYRSRLGETGTMGAPLGREKAAATEVDTIFDFLKRGGIRGAFVVALMYCRIMYLPVPTPA